MKNSNDPFESLITNVAKREALTDDERARMRGWLREYATMKPRRIPTAHTTFFDSAFSRVARPLRIGLAAALSIFLATGGVAYAAEGTLPGDLLYPVKVDVTEPVHTAFIGTPAAQANWQMTLATRRVDEAATLAAEGKLSTTTQEALSVRFAKSADAAAAAVAKEGTTSPENASVERTVFSMRLSAYGAVLAQIDKNRNASSTQTLRAVLTQHIAALSGDAENVPTDNATGTARVSAHENTQKAVAHIGAQVDAVLNTSADLLGSARDELTASTSATAQDQFTHATALKDQGNVLLQKGDDAGAYAAYRDSLSAAAQLDVLTHAAATLHVDAFQTDEENASSTSASSTVRTRQRVRHTFPQTITNPSGDGHDAGD